MAITSGFFNSLNGDRKYNARSHCEITSSLVTDGVHPNYGTRLFPQETDIDNSINIGIGRTWFHNAWLKNDNLHLLTMDPSDLLLPRWDVVYLVVDERLEFRTCDIGFKTGIPASDPQFPELVDTDLTKYKIMMYIKRMPNTTKIVLGDIDNRITTSLFPLMTGILETVTTDELLAGWQSDFVTWNDQKRTEFEEWFATIKDILDADVAGNLLNKINQVEAYAGDIDSLRAENTSNIAKLNYIKAVVIDNTALIASDLISFPYMYTLVHTEDFINEDTTIRANWNIYGSMLTDADSYKRYKESYSKLSYLETKNGYINFYFSDEISADCCILLTVESLG